MNCILITSHPWDVEMVNVLKKLPDVRSVVHVTDNDSLRELLHRRSKMQNVVLFIPVRGWDIRLVANITHLPPVVFLSTSRARISSHPDDQLDYHLSVPLQSGAVRSLVQDLEAHVVQDLRFLLVSIDRRYRKINLSDIELIEKVDSSYIRIYLTEKTWLVNDTLADMLGKLPEGEFKRISDEIIVPVAADERRQLSGDRFVFRDKEYLLTQRFKRHKERRRTLIV